MTKILKSKFKASRRLGVSIWGSDKDTIHKRNYRPGQHAAAHRKGSDYAVHLTAKQRLKSHYGRINERQFHNIFKLATKKKGDTGENLIMLLETRLDVAVYRMGFAPSIFSARQLVSHKHILVNGEKINIPSYRLSIGDEVSIIESSRGMPLITTSIDKRSKSAPDYYSLNDDQISGKLTRFPSVSDVPYPFEPDVQVIIEYYSK